jgi:hypothetical protein
MGFAGAQPVLRAAGCGLPMSFRPGQIGRFSVRECDDDQETDHDKGDHISIKPFPIHMDLHWAALLFFRRSKQRAKAGGSSTAAASASKNSVQAAEQDRRHEGS